MSQYSLQIQAFIDKSLAPKIKKLNLQLISMEEFGYDNIKLRAARKAVNKLIPIYDFLNEYAKGNEEAEWKVLRDLISATGLSYSTEQVNDTLTDYQIWYGATPEPFGIVGTQNLMNIANQPDDTLNYEWLRYTDIGRQFTTNLTGYFDSVSTDVHGLIVCPPGITVSSIQINSGTGWHSLINGTHYNSYEIDDIETGAGLKTYTCYYTRSIDQAHLADSTYRFFTTGAITQ